MDKPRPITIQQNEFKEELAMAFLEAYLDHFQGDRILRALNTEPNMKYLPVSTRTILKTPRIFNGKLHSVPPGEYLHIGIQKGIKKILNITPKEYIPNCLEIDWSSDGCALNKKFCLWPIQIRISNIENCIPQVVGIYAGRKKPENVDILMHNFITEINIIREDGLLYNDKHLTIHIRAGIFDLPANAMFLKHYNHNSKKQPCTKCKVTGRRYRRTTIFLGVDHELRTNKEYSLAEELQHHKGKTPLLKMDMKIVDEVPIDPMHCVYIRANKKILYAWTTPKYKT